MKRLSIVLVTVLVACTGCFKDEGCEAVKPTAEEAQIVAYASSNAIPVVKHSSGVYYQIINPGTGTTPSVSSRIYITYTGKLLTGAVFDQATNPSNTGWQLAGLIEGWQIGIPLIKKGGKIRLLIPSAYGYGCNGAGTIPANAILDFEVDLIDVQ